MQPYSFNSFNCLSTIYGWMLQVLRNWTKLPWNKLFCFITSILILTSILARICCLDFLGTISDIVQSEILSVAPKVLFVTEVPIICVLLACLLVCLISSGNSALHVLFVTALLTGVFKPANMFFLQFLNFYILKESENFWKNKVLHFDWCRKTLKGMCFFICTRESRVCFLNAKYKENT